MKGSDFEWQAVRSRETPPAPREALALKFYGVTREYETSDFLTGASQDKAGSIHPLPFEAGRDFERDFGRTRLEAGARKVVKH